MTSVKTRLVLATGLLACAAIAAVALALRQGARQEFFRFQDLERQGSLAALQADAARLAQRLDGRCCDGAVMTEAASELPEGRAMLVVDSRGSLVARSGPGIGDIRDLATRLEGSTLILTGARQRGPQLERVELRLEGMGTPLRLAAGGAGQLFLIGLPARDADVNAESNARAFLGSLDRTILGATMLFGVAAVGLTWLLARRALKPVDDLRAASRAIARGELSHRAPVTTTDELGELARAFNIMAAELERQETLRRNLLHDVAHELRTPLTALRCRLETIVDGLAADPAQALGGANEEVVHLGRLVDDLQELALAEAGELRLDVADVNVAPVAGSALAAAGLSDDPRVSVEIPEGLAVRADAIRLRQILLNLLTNAGRHTPGGHRIALRARRDGSDAVIEVANTGSTLDEAQRGRVFDRFYRTDRSRRRSTGGSGLGLAIVKTLVEAQGGRVWVTSTDDEVVFGFTAPTASC